MLRCWRAPVEIIVFLHVRTGAGIVVLEIAECRRAGLVEPPLDVREVSHRGRMRQIVRYGPDARDQWKEVRLVVGERELDGLRWQRRLAPQNCGIEIEQGGDDGFAIVQDGRAD